MDDTLCRMNGVAEFLHYYITEQHIQHFTLYARPGAALRALQQTVGATLRSLPGIDARVEIVAAPDLYVNRLAVNQQLDAACYRDQVQWQTKCGTRALAFDIDWVVDLDFDELLHNARDRRTLPTLLQALPRSVGAARIEMFECFPQRRVIADTKVAVRPIALREFMNHDSESCGADAGAMITTTLLV
jgi:hypothetical protein